MRIRKQRMEALGVLPAAAQDRDFYYAGAIPCCFSRSRCNWLDKLRASKGFPMEPKVEIEEFVKSLSLQGNSSGDSKSGLTATLVSSAACIATRCVKDCSMQKSGVAGECKLEPGEDLCTWNDKRAELLLGSSTDLVQSEHCDSFDPDTGCRNISNSSEGQSQVCPSDGSSQAGRQANKSSPEIDNADMANGRVVAEKSNKHEYVLAFGLPPGDFEQSVITAATMVKKQQRKRKQERPKNCPKGYDSPGQEVTGPLLQRRDMELRRSYYMVEKGSPDSENPNPSCRVQLTLRDDYVTATPLKTCMEKMQAFSLRSNSSTESDGNSSDSTSDSLNLHRRGIRRRTTKKVQDHHAEGSLCSKRRKLYVGAAVTPFQVEGQSLHRKEHVAHLQMQRRTFQSTGFIADFHTMRTPQGLKLPLDHPACQPKDTLVYSVYQVFMKAGKTGLTAREAVSKILEEGLPGLDECGVVARVEVGKIVRTSPYFMELEESKFVLCSAITGIEDKLNSSARADKGKESQGNQNQMQNWAALAVRRARTGKTRRKPSVPVFRKPVSEDSSSHRTQAAATGGTGAVTAVLQPQRKRRLKSVQQDSTGLGNRCNRSDGKGWHCPLLAQVGYLLCDHHLDRLRAKSGSKARRPNKNRAERRGGQEQHYKQQHQNQQHQQQVRKGTGFKAPSLSATGNRNSKKAESWGIRQSLSSVARGGRSSKRVVRCLPDEEQATESGEVITTTFGL